MSVFARTLVGLFCIVTAAWITGCPKPGTDAGSEVVLDRVQDLQISRLREFLNLAAFPEEKQAVTVAQLAPQVLVYGSDALVPAGWPSGEAQPTVAALLQKVDRFLNEEAPVWIEKDGDDGLPLIAARAQTLQRWLLAVAQNPVQPPGLATGSVRVFLSVRAAELGELYCLAMAKGDAADWGVQQACGTDAALAAMHDAFALMAKSMEVQASLLAQESVDETAFVFAAHAVSQTTAGASQAVTVRAQTLLSLAASFDEAHTRARARYEPGLMTVQVGAMEAVAALRGLADAPRMLWKAKPEVFAAQKQRFIDGMAAVDAAMDRPIPESAIAGFCLTPAGWKGCFGGLVGSVAFQIARNQQVPVINAAKDLVAAVRADAGVSAEAKAAAESLDHAFAAWDASYGVLMSLMEPERGAFQEVVKLILVKQIEIKNALGAW